MLKKVLLILSSIFFKLALYLFALTWAGVAVFGTPGPLKSALDESSAYSDFSSALVNEARNKISPDPKVQEVFKDPEVYSRLGETLSPEATQKTTEPAVDSIYRWLNGDTSYPDFKMDFAYVHDNLVPVVSDYIAERFNSLPVCTPAQLQTISPTINPLSVECRPPGVTEAAVRQEVLKATASSTQNLSVRAEDIKDENGNNIFTQLEAAPRKFQIFKKLPIIFAVITAFAAAGVVLLNASRRKGLKIIGINLVGTGALLLVSAWLIIKLADAGAKPGGAIDKLMPAEAQRSALEVFRSLNNSFDSQLIRVSIAYIVLGALLLLGLWLLGRRRSKEIVTDTPTATAGPN